MTSKLNQHLGKIYLQIDEQRQLTPLLSSSSTRRFAFFISRFSITSLLAWRNTPASKTKYTHTVLRIGKYIYNTLVMGRKFTFLNVKSIEQMPVNVTFHENEVEVEEKDTLNINQKTQTMKTSFKLWHCFSSSETSAQMY